MLAMVVGEPFVTVEDETEDAQLMNALDDI